MTARKREKSTAKKETWIKRKAAGIKVEENRKKGKKGDKEK